MDPPIACSLSATDRGERLVQSRALVARSLRARSGLPDGVRLHFAAASGVAEQLRDLVAAEAQCCAFLHMDLHREDERFVLDATGPAEARAIIEELFA